ncbi:MAG: four helix bundle protein [Alphaproteobacteria bacterium]|nr:four helix bundle protein [Alphaproteobacteria bacterium]
MMKVLRFEELEVWKDARVICGSVNEICNVGSFRSDYKFRDQVRSSAGSIMDNIAEGFERDGRKEFIQFLSIAKGSCGEIRSQLYRAIDYGYISAEKAAGLLEQTLVLSKKLSCLMTYLKSSQIKGLKFKPET